MNSIKEFVPFDRYNLGTNYEELVNVAVQVTKFSCDAFCTRLLMVQLWPHSSILRLMQQKELKAQCFLVWKHLWFFHQKNYKWAFLVV